MTAGWPAARHSDRGGLSDDALVAAVRRGEDRAFEMLYCRHGARVQAIVRRLLGDRERAEDVCQEVFIAALRQLRRTGSPIVFRPWIAEIARNASLDELRRSGRRRREVPLGHDDGCGPAATWLITPGPSPQARLELRQRLDDLRGALRGLTEVQRRILVMREFEGCSYGEIGSAPQISGATVESALFRARRRLGEELAELESGRRCATVQAWIETPARAGRGRLGVRERRQLTCHLEHCRRCRASARRAGLDAQLRPLAGPTVSRWPPAAGAPAV